MRSISVKYVSLKKVKLLYFIYPIIYYITKPLIKKEQTMKKVLSVAILLLSGWLFAGEDRHFIQDDDYFINEDKDLGDRSWIYVKIAKMIEPASSSTKNEAKFMTVPQGKEIWTRYYWQSRPVQTESELKLGTIVLICEKGEHNVYVAPKDADDARIRHQWFMAKIIDLSKAYKGVVKVSGGYDVSRENIRLLGNGGFTPVKTENNSGLATPPAVSKPVTPPAKVNTGNKSGCGTLKIIKAVYGSLNNMMDVKDYIEEFCKNGQITATASDDFFNSSMDTDEDKNLYIRYQTMAGEFEVQVLQGETVTIPGKSHKRLK